MVFAFDLVAAASKQSSDTDLTWIPTLSAALLGALVGGLFSLVAQSKAAKNQLAAQIARDEVERSRSATEWARVQEAQARADSLDEARRLHREFAAIHRELQESDLTVHEILTRVSWRPRWRGIWTVARSLDLDVSADLLRDEHARTATHRVIRLLDGAPDIARGGWPGSVSMPLRTLGLNLTGVGAKVLAAYLRREAPPADWDVTLEVLDKNLKAFEEWQEGQIEAAEAAHEEEDAERRREEQEESKPE